MTLRAKPIAAQSHAKLPLSELLAMSTELTDLERNCARAIVHMFENGRPVGGYGIVTLLFGDAGQQTYSDVPCPRESGE